MSGDDREDLLERIVALERAAADLERKNLTLQHELGRTTRLVVASTESTLAAYAQLRSRDAGNDRLTAYVRKKVAELIAENGVTQAWLCRRTGVSPKHLSRLLKGHAGVSVDLADRLLLPFGQQLAFGVRPTEFETFEVVSP